MASKSLVAKKIRAELMQYMHQNDIEISGLAETNTNWEFNNINEILSTKARLQFKNSLINFSKNDFNVQSESGYQPGGCALVCTHHWTSRVTDRI
jgi:hypothetical protein